MGPCCLGNIGSVLGARAPAISASTLPGVVSSFRYRANWASFLLSSSDIFDAISFPSFAVLNWLRYSFKDKFCKIFILRCVVCWTVNQQILTQMLRFIFLHNIPGSIGFQNTCFSNWISHSWSRSELANPTLLDHCLSITFCLLIFIFSSKF